MKRLVLEVPHAGLGDHLFLSPIPRLAKERGWDRVFISERSLFRSPEVRRLVWEMNPYVDGFVEEPGISAGDVDPQRDENILSAMARAYGLPEIPLSFEPEVYYEPKFIAEFSHLRAFDPNYVSFVGFVSPKKVLDVLGNEGVIHQLKIRGRSWPLPGSHPVIETKTLFDYCDFIHSVGSFSCLTSGSATLAAALKKRANVFWGFRQKRIFHHSALHEYIYAPASPHWMLKYYVQKYVLKRELNIRGDV